MAKESEPRRARRQFSDEFRAAAVRQMEEGKTMAPVARDLDVVLSCLTRWVTQARADRTNGRSGLTSEERAELSRLKKEVRELRMERDIQEGRGLLRERERLRFALADAEKAVYPLTSAQDATCASDNYQKLLAAHGIICSMSRAATASTTRRWERWFSI